MSSFSLSFGESVRVRDPFLQHRYFRFPADQRRVVKRARKIASKEPGTVRWLDENLLPDDIFYDIGANVGVYTIFAAARVPDGQVFAFEPHVGTFAVLLGTLGLNPDFGAVTPLCLALDAADGWTDFAYRDLMAGSTGSQVAASPVTKKMRSSVVELKPVCSVDELVAAGVITPPTVVKVDVDGNELNILRGMRQQLEQASIRSIQIEVDPSLSEPVQDFMKACGYQEVYRHRSSAGEQHVAAGNAPETYCANVIFAPGAAASR